MKNCILPWILTKRTYLWSKKLLFLLIPWMFILDSNPLIEKGVILNFQINGKMLLKGFINSTIKIKILSYSFVSWITMRLFYTWTLYRKIVMNSWKLNFCSRRQNLKKSWKVTKNKLNKSYSRRNNLKKKIIHLKWGG